MREPTFIDFFAGISGFRLALESAGWKCVGSCEIDPFCADVQLARFGQRPKFIDITKIDPSSLPEADMWCGGFPCQDLSVAGKREGIRGERSGLFWTLMKLVAARKPRLLFLENVPGLLTSNEGQDVLDILDAINEAGYLCDADICDAQHFGVPQRRRRVFFVGERLALGAARGTEIALRGGSIAALETCRAAFGELVHKWGGWPEPRDPEGMRAEVRRKERFFREHGPPGLWERLPAWAGGALAGKPHDCAKAGCLAPSPLWGAAGGPGAAGHMEPEGPRPPAPPGPAALGSWLDIVATACGQPPAGPSMDSLIHDCAEAALAVAWAAIEARAGCPRWREVWPAAAEAAREVSVYAGVAGQDLFVGVEGREEWRRIHGEADLALVALRGLGAPCGPEILPEPEGGAGDSPEGPQEGEGAAPAPEGGAREAGGQADSPKIAEGGLARALGGVGGGNDYGANKGTLIQGAEEKAAAVTSHNQAEQSYRGGGTDNIVPGPDAPPAEDKRVRPTLTAMGLTGGKGRTPYDYDAHIVTDQGREDAQGRASAPAADGPAHAVSKGSGGGLGGRDGQDDYVIGGPGEPVAFAERTRDGVKNVEVMEGGVSPALTNPGAGGRSDAVRVLARATEAAPIPFEDDSAASAPRKPRIATGHGRTMAAAPAGPIAIHADAARSSGGAAKTPSPDASGRARLRDPGLGVSQDGKQFTLNASAPHAVAVQDGTGTAPTLRTGGNSHKDSYNTVALEPAVALRDERGRSGGERTAVEQSFPLHCAKGPSEQQVVLPPGERRPPVEGVDMRGNKGGTGSFQGKELSSSAMHGHDVHAVAVEGGQPELPFPAGPPAPAPRPAAPPEGLDAPADSTAPVVALDTYNQSASEGAAPAVRPRRGGDNVPTVAVPPGATAFHRNASCNVADQQGRSAALKANGEHSYQFLGIPAAAPPAPPAEDEKGSDHGAAQA